MLRKVLKIIGWTFGTLVALCVVVYLIVLAINWRDQEPSPAAVCFENLHRDRPVVADSDNALVFLLGFTVAPGESPAVMGSRRLAWLETLKPGTVVNVGDDPLGERPDYQPKRPPDVSKFLAACRPGHAECASAFEEAVPALEQWKTAEGWLLERYRSLLAYPAWREPVYDMTAPLPAYALVLDGQRFFLLNAGGLAAEGDHAGVQEILDSDLRFWRKVLESSDILISRMIATAAIKRHFELGNLVLRKFPVGSGARAVPDEWRKPLSDSERSMLRCLVGEWMFTSGMLRGEVTDYYVENEEFIVRRGLARMMTPLYQPQDSVNDYAEFYARTAEILDVPLSELEAASAQTAVLGDRLRDEKFPPRSAYNIVGQILVGVGGLDFGPYARRVGDIEGARRAALAAVTLRDANVEVRDVAAALADLPLRDPYSDKPFTWDEEHAAILFRGLEAGERGEHRFIY